MKRIIAFMTVFVAIAFIGASATIIDVPDDYPTIQEGIDASSDGDTVLVQPETYFENINFNGHNIVLGSLFLTTGDTSYISTTIIDGGSIGRVISLLSGEDSTTVIAGFTIQNGYYSPSFGGGIFCLGNSSPIIKYNNIINNYAQNGAGITCFAGSHARIIHNYINNNEARFRGGGIYIRASDPIIRNNTISNNSAQYSGAGINCLESNPTIDSCEIINNNVTVEGTGGGGISCSACPNVTITSSNISNNNVPYFSDGGGIRCWNSDSYIGNNRIYNNHTGNSSEGGGIYVRGSTNIVNNIIEQNGGPNQGAGIYVIGDAIIEGNYINDNITTFRWGYSRGGGIYGIGNISIINNVIEGNDGSESGGGIFCRADSFFVVIDGNEIRNNTALIGAGISCGGPFSITDNIIENNVSYSAGGFQISGGGISCGGGSSRLSIIAFNAIRHNTVGDDIHGMPGQGGGLSAIGNILITANQIENNSASLRGGGGYFYGGEVKLIGNRIANNEAGERGGGIWAHNVSGGIIQNTIYDNLSWADGGGCYIVSEVSIINCVVSGNTAYNNGGGMAFQGVNSIVVNSIIRNNEAYNQGNEIYLLNEDENLIIYSDIEGGWEGDGNIDVDPLFRDPDSGDFHLMSAECGDPYDSPCIDRGSPAIIDSLLDCSWGLGTILSDMGAYGGGDSVTVGIDDYLNLIAKRLTLNQNFPNPFNTSTAIRYSLPQASDVKIDIYDILGRKVETLIQGEQPAGYHQITWDADKQTSGMYFYRIQAGEYAETRKMVLIK